MVKHFSGSLAMPVALLLALSLSGCGEDTSPIDDETSQAARVDRSALHGILGGGHYDYIEVDEPEDLAEQPAVDVALVGTVKGYENGPDVFPDDETDKTVLLRVSPTDVFDGRFSEDGLALVMMTVSPDVQLADLEAALPAGAPTALYLNKAVDMPPGSPQPIWVPVSPQGFITEDDQGSVFPLDSELDNDQTLEEQVPPEVNVPERDGT